MAVKRVENEIKKLKQRRLKYAAAGNAKMAMNIEGKIMGLQGGKK